MFNYQPQLAIAGFLNHQQQQWRIDHLMMNFLRYLVTFHYHVSLPEGECLFDFGMRTIFSMINLVI